MNVNI